MSDTPPTNAPPNPDEAAQIDQPSLERWFTIPDDKLVAIIATRSEFDQLFIGLRQMMFAQGNTLAALQQFAKGDVERTDSTFNLAAQQHLQALASITRFTSAVMAKAEPYER